MLTACGGSSGTDTLASLATQYANLGTDFSAATITPEASLPTASASYAGVINIGLGTGAGPKDGAYGNLTVDVNFGANTLTGSANNFVHYDQSSASGSLAITGGVLTGNNTGIGDGLTANASGTVSGTALDFDVTGHFAGDNAEAVYLYLDPTSSSDPSLGVGIAIKP